MSRLWLRAINKLIVDNSNKLLLCGNCPCDTGTGTGPPPPPGDILIPCCPDELIPEQLTADVQINGDCAAVSGTYTIQYYANGPPGSGHVLGGWYANLGVIRGTQPLYLRFTCLNFSPGIFYWYAEILCLNIFGGSSVRGYGSSNTFSSELPCRPLSVEIPVIIEDAGPFADPSQCCYNGEGIVTVTE